MIEIQMAITRAQEVLEEMMRQYERMEGAIEDTSNRITSAFEGSANGDDVEIANLLRYTRQGISSATQHLFNANNRLGEVRTRL